MRKKFSNTGISLISLIITIIVIIILAAIVIFSGMDTPEKAQLSKVISDIDNVQTAVDQAYYGLYTEKAVAGEVWTPSQFYEAVATGEKNRDNLTGTGLIEISENSLVDINLPKYEGRKWYIAVSDVSDTVKTGSAVLSPGFESQGKTYATLLDIQTGGSDGSGTNGGNGSDETFVAVEPTNVNDWEWTELEDGTLCITKYSGSDTEVVIPNSINGKRVTAVNGSNNGITRENIWGEDICEPDINAYIGKRNWQKTISKITISYGIEKIGDCAFEFSANLKEVVIPSSVIEMGSSVILCEYPDYDGGAIDTTVTCHLKNKPEGWDENWSDCTNVIWEVQYDSLETEFAEWQVYYSSDYRGVCVWIEEYLGSETDVAIPNIIGGVPVRIIAGEAFKDCTSLTNVTIPSSVNKIWGCAFENISPSATITCHFNEKPKGWNDDWTDCTNVIWAGE